MSKKESSGLNDNFGRHFSIIKVMIVLIIIITIETIFELLLSAFTLTMLIVFSFDYSTVL